jgi:ribonuclease T2
MGDLARFARLFLLPVFFACAVAGCSENETGSATPPSTDNARSARSTPPAVPEGTGFDFYVLALSWSPTYCLNEGRDRGNRTQCGDDRAHGFIVHGLWPQFDSGYPEYCPSRESDRVSDRLGRVVMDITPSMGLIGHMWRKHGTCSGLDQADYFGVVRAARDTVAVPDLFDTMTKQQMLSTEAVEKAFVETNPGLARDAIATVCQGGQLREVRICLTKSLAFRSCPEVDRSGCRAGSVSVPPPG